MTLRVINLGLPKTGTTTFARALKLSGLKTADYRIRPKQTADTSLHGVYVGDLIYRGYFETSDPLALLTGFDAISEMSALQPDLSLWPQTDFGIIDAVRRHHPSVKFVATRRATWKVSQSILGWSNLGTDRLPNGDIPGLPKGFGDTSKERETWIDAHYAHLSAIFAGDPAYMELDVTADDAAARLSAHIDHDIPWWGRANRNTNNDQVA